MAKSFLFLIFSPWSKRIKTAIFKFTIKLLPAPLAIVALEPDCFFEAADDSYKLVFLEDSKVACH